MGLDYKAGQAGAVNTAAGVVPAWRVTFNTVKVGSITLNQVDGMVVESGLNVPLLGMSFLNRMEMKRDGQTMTLTSAIDLRPAFECDKACICRPCLIWNAAMGSYCLVLSRSISAYALWLWIDSKFSASTT